MDREDNSRPGIGETIFVAFSTVNSHPALFASWLVLALVGAGLMYVADLPGLSLPGQIVCWIIFGLYITFIHAGYIGSFELLLKLGSWSPISVIECARHYFARFFFLNILIGLLAVISSVLIGLIWLAGLNIHLIISILIIPVALAAVAVAFLLIFSPAGVVVEEKTVFGAIAYSFRMVRSNLLLTLALLFLFSGLPRLLSLLVGKLYSGGLPWPQLLFNTLIAAYGLLLLTYALVYFAVESRCTAPGEI